MAIPGYDYQETQPPGTTEGTASSPDAGASTEWFRTQLNALYQKYYQRDATDEEFRSHYRNPGGLAAVEVMLKGAGGTTTPPPSDTGGTGPNNDTAGDYAAFGRLWLASGGRTMTDLAAFIAAHPGFGATLNAKGNKVTIAGRTFDAVLASGEGGGRGATWDEGGGDGGTTTTGSADPYLATINSLIDRLTNKPAADLPTFYDAPPAFEYADFAPPSWDLPAFEAPGPFSYEQYALPSGEEVLAQDPGYPMRVKEGQRAITNNASAGGLLKSGQTMKGLADYVEALASQEYGTAADRDFGVWQANRGAAAEDYDRLWRNAISDYSIKYGAEGDEFNRAQSTYSTNLGKEATKYGFGLDVAAGKAGGTQGATSLAGNLALGSGGLALNQSSDYWANLLSLYDLSTRNLPTYTTSATNSSTTY
jgi:hypothetical protein